MLTWLDQRTGLVTLTKDFLTEDVPGGASYWYAFGSATLFAMILQIVTGIFLCFYYAPSTDTAWESTKYIIEKVPAGHLVLSLHYWGASAMIAFVAMHLLQVLLWGAYKKPRELQWIVGVILFIVTLVLGLTGYLLPWDLNALLASTRRDQHLRQRAVFGPLVQQFLQDGNGITTLTINRFFGIHVWLMPALLVLLVGLHLMIFRWNGPAGPPIDEAPKLKPGRFWPDQMFMDTVLSFAMFVIIIALAVFAPVPLDDKADLEQLAVRARIRLGISSRCTRCSTSSVSSRPRSCRSPRCSRRSSARRCSSSCSSCCRSSTATRRAASPAARGCSASPRWCWSARSAELGRPAQRRREPTAAQHHRRERPGRSRRQRQRRSPNRPARNGRLDHRQHRRRHDAGNGGQRRNGVLDQLRRLSRRHRNRCTKHVPAAGRQPGRHRRSEQGHPDRAQRPQRQHHRQGRNLQRHDAAVESHAEQQADRGRAHLHPQRLGQ
jgi:hypothetical protein